MAKKTYDAIDKLHAAVMTANENKKCIDLLRPDAEAALGRLLRSRKKTKNFSGEIEYNGYIIRVQRRTVIQFMGECEEKKGDKEKEAKRN